MLRIAVGAGAAALMAAGAATAQDGDVSLDRVQLADGSAEVTVSRTLEDRRAIFGLGVSRDRQEGEETVSSGGEGMYEVRLAGARRHARLRVERMMCDEVVGIMGTVTRRVARVELVAQDGMVTRLRRHRAPGRWTRFRGRVIGSVQPSAASVAEVRAKLRGGKVVARVKPGPVTPCPEG